MERPLVLPISKRRGIQRVHCLGDVVNEPCISGSINDITDQFYEACVVKPDGIIHMALEHHCKAVNRTFDKFAVNRMEITEVIIDRETNLQVR